MTAVPPTPSPPPSAPSASDPTPPLVVGTCWPANLAPVAAMTAAERDADVVEARLDLALDLPASDAPAPSTAAPAQLGAALAACRDIEASGTPVLATIRLRADGGRWQGDAGRLPLFDDALAVASLVDVEVESAIAAEVIGRARRRGRRVIVSHHDFTGTPDLASLEALCDRAAALGADIVKIAAFVRSLADHAPLIELLRRRRGQALAVIAMGPWGTALRSYLPVAGSRLTYGYLDTPVAPGQIAARAMIDRLRVDCPTYVARAPSR